MRRRGGGRHSPNYGCEGVDKEEVVSEKEIACVAGLDVYLSHHTLLLPAAFQFLASI